MLEAASSAPGAPPPPRAPAAPSQPHAPTAPVSPGGKALSLEEVQKLVAAHNKSEKASDELVVCLIWKESNFHPAPPFPKGGTASGLMQVTKGAVQDVNNNHRNEHFEHQEMTDPARNIECGTLYLELRITRAGALKKGLDSYGTGKGYSDNILACEMCLQGKPTDPKKCLVKIHT